MNFGSFAANTSCRSKATVSSISPLLYLSILLSLFVDVHFQKTRLPAVVVIRERADACAVLVLLPVVVRASLVSVGKYNHIIKLFKRHALVSKLYLSVFRGLIIIPMLVKKPGDCNRVFENVMHVAVLLFVVNY